MENRKSIKVPNVRLKELVLEEENIDFSGVCPMYLLLEVKLHSLQLFPAKTGKLFTLKTLGWELWVAMEDLLGRLFLILSRNIKTRILVS